MGKSAFASAIITKMRSAIGTNGRNFNSGTPAVAMAAFAEAITEYLIANTVVAITYDGIITETGSPDPVVSDTFNIIGSCAPPISTGGFDTWCQQLQANIIAGFALAPIGDNGIVFETRPFLNITLDLSQQHLQPLLTNAHDASDTNPQQKVWEIICQAIIEWIGGTAKNTVPGPATNPSASSAGQAKITSITIT